jgi:threonine/homoserine/homoserine lactone efflux protein
MPEPSALLLFVPAALVLLLTPGPAVLYIVARSLEQGPGAGVISAAGVALGTIAHVGAAALGLSALLIASPAALGAVRLLGAGYLIYLGMRRVFDHATAPHSPSLRTTPARRIFLQGLVVNLFNPKTALFVFAFLPQFVDPALGDAAFQVSVLGLILTTLGLVSDSGYALLAGNATGWLRSGSRPGSAPRRISGGVLIALGVASACSGVGE